MFDNKLFNVNGRGPEMLAKTIDLAFHQEWGNFMGANSEGVITGWRFSPTAGIILTYSQSDGVITKYNKFVTPLSLLDAAKFVIRQLESDESQAVPLERWEDNMDHDGHNSIGWRAYLGDWGQIDSDWYALVAIKRVYLWHGK